MSEWKEYPLDEIYTISSGLSKPGSEFGFGSPFLSFKEIYANRKVPEKLTELVNSSERDKERCSIKRGDVFLLRTSENVEELGLSSVSLCNYEDATFNGFAKRLRPKEKDIILPEYAMYLFCSWNVRKQIVSFASITTRSSLNNDIIQSIKIRIPKISIQKPIASILFNLDSKIDLLRRQNQTLENIAQALFKRWFIDFEFPDKNGKPYKSSGGKMVESGLGEIPEGWEVGRHEDIYQNFDSKRIPLSGGEREKRQGIYPYHGATKVMDYIDDYIFDGTYLLLGEDGSVIDENGFPILQYVWGKMWINNHTHVLQGKNSFSTEQLYLLMKRTSVSNIVTGAVQLKINQSNLNSVETVIPDDNVNNCFNSIIKNIFDKTKNNTSQIQTLTKTRDTLLPKLMSGQIRVKDL